ncbi:MAG: hypothetical protein KA354_16575 [Phycisphaerae bacterium]|nr:hypothetical protein [Phycisphaerae bacterium]
MKVTCPKCQKVLQAPDGWAGKTVKCPGCKDPIKLPQPDSGGDAGGIDLGSLKTFEAVGQVIVPDQKAKPMTLKQAQQAAVAAAAEAEAAKVDPAKHDPNVRTCPKCKQKVKCADLYSEVMCRHCGTGIPGLMLTPGQQAKYSGSMADRIGSSVTFYSGFSSAATYPLPALGSIGAGMAIALATIVVPVGVVLAFIASSSLNPASRKPGEEIDYGWVGIAISTALVVQGIYFGSVCYYMLIDAIRTTKSGAEAPPNLTWNIINLGAALGGYGALLGMYLLTAVLLVTAVKGFPGRISDFAALGQPVPLIILALMTFGVPMNLIGLSSSQAMDGLNPVKVGKSILNTHGNYAFLFLVTLLYLGIFIGIMAAVLNWAWPMIMSVCTTGIASGVVNALLGVVAWTVVIGFGFYFACSIGRVLGLFCRTYKEKLQFEL